MNIFKILRKVVLFLLPISILVIYITETSSYFSPLLILVVEILAIFCSIALGVIGISRKKKGYILIAIYLFLFPVCSFFAGGYINAIKNSASIKRGKNILLAINNYHNDHSAYPSSLEDLPPKYIDKIPFSAMRLFQKEEFGYYTYDMNSKTFYVVGFIYTAGMRTFYDSQFDKWITDD